ncbi:MAG: hypothetical protein IT381_18530 [Deltaproteobacteria bacterium]|nr:hypothetical protein [Deltaproteobacteria bacterium]
MIALALFVAAAAPASKPTEPMRELTIVYMSNRHAAVAPCHCDSAPLGGVDRQAGAIADLRKKNRAVLVLDGGDNFFESPEQAKAADAMSRAELLADALDRMRPDLMMAGERDFLRGGPVLRELGLRAKAAWVASNVMPPVDKPSMFKPYLLAKLGEQRVLVLAVYAKSTFPKPLADEKYTLQDPIEAIERLLAMYKSYADLIVVVAHTDGQTEEKIATKVQGVSIVLNGHEGRLQFGTRAYGDVQSLAAGNLGKYLVHVDLRYKGVLPKLEAGMDVQKFFRDARTNPGKTALNQGLGLKNTLFFQLLPLANDVSTIEELRTRARAIDPVGYELSAAASKPSQ